MSGQTSLLYIVVELDPGAMTSHSLAALCAGTVCLMSVMTVASLWQPCQPANGSRCKAAISQYRPSRVNWAKPDTAIVPGLPEWNCQMEHCHMEQYQMEHWQMEH